MRNQMDLLFVDDQWCTNDGRNIIYAEYGKLLEADPQYRFHFETAEINNGISALSGFCRAELPATTWYAYFIISYYQLLHIVHTGNAIISCLLST